MILSDRYDRILIRYLLSSRIVFFIHTGLRIKKVMRAYNSIILWRIENNEWDTYRAMLHVAFSTFLSRLVWRSIGSWFWPIFSTTYSLGSSESKVDERFLFFGISWNLLFRQIVSTSIACCPTKCLLHFKVRQLVNFSGRWTKQQIRSYSDPRP